MLVSMGRQGLRMWQIVWEQYSELDVGEIVKIIIVGKEGRGDQSEDTAVEVGSELIKLKTYFFFKISFQWLYHVLH